MELPSALVCFNNLSCSREIEADWIRFTFSSDVSRTSTVSVSAYLRTAQCVNGQDDMGNDILMGRVDLIPVLDTHVCYDLILSYQFF